MVSCSDAFILLVVRSRLLARSLRIKMRNSLSEVYFGKTKDVIGELRTIEGSERQRQEAMLRNELLGAFGRRK